MKKRLVIFFLAAAMVLGGCENKIQSFIKRASRRSNRRTT